MDGQGNGALERWREQLEGWAIPAQILAAAPEPPWSYPVGVFRSRARRAGSRPATPSNREAARHLPEGGTVLDVGAGAGAASLPLAGTAGRLVAVDESPEMLASFLAAAEAAGGAAGGGRGERAGGGLAPGPGRRGRLPPRALQRGRPGPVRQRPDRPRPPPGGGRADRPAPAGRPAPAVAAVPRPGPPDRPGRRRRRGRPGRHRPGRGPPGLGEPGTLRLRRLRRAGGL